MLEDRNFVAIYAPSLAAFQQFGTPSFYSQLLFDVGQHVKAGDVLISFDGFFDDEMRKRTGGDPPKIHAPISGRIHSLGADFDNRIGGSNKVLSGYRTDIRGDELVLLIEADPDQNLRLLEDEQSREWIRYALYYRKKKIKKVWWTQLFYDDWSELTNKYTRDKVMDTQIVEVVKKRVPSS